MTQYDPEDLLGPESMNLVAFEKDVCMEKCAVNVFLNEYGEVDFRCLQEDIMIINFSTINKVRLDEFLRQNLREKLFSQVIKS